ncbi:unnamed protein product [Prorocentrum cordatum]|uniref:Uncharacterized protein n=1 Tax=Prorocentrum cordatum TaxID=2364126 RepID=A0ABN9WIT4_9DINO|nr:unnamed protein product [Polarella glacialis]
MAASAAEDERTARQMQEAEMGQAPHFAHGAVVQGVAVHPHAVSIGAPRLSTGPVVVEAIPDLPTDELIVLSLRYTVMCFGLIDFVLQLIRDVFFWAALTQCRREECTAIEGIPLWTVGLIQAALFVGPLCGIIGARRLQRGPVSVYLCFCIFNLIFVLTSYLWFLIFLIVQMWITWIVCKFWSALGTISRDRVVQMRDPDYLEKAPVRIVYW